MKVRVYTCARCGRLAIGSRVRLPSRWRSATECPCVVTGVRKPDMSPQAFHAWMAHTRRRRGRNR